MVREFLAWGWPSSSGLGEQIYPGFCMACARRRRRKQLELVTRSYVKQPIESVEEKQTEFGVGQR